jgi:hypothetical protein
VIYRVTNNGPWQIKVRDVRGIEQRLLPGKSRVIDGPPVAAENIGAPAGETEVRYYAQPIFAP